MTHETTNAMGIEYLKPSSQYYDKEATHGRTAFITRRKVSIYGHNHGNSGGVEDTDRSKRTTIKAWEPWPEVVTEPGKPKRSRGKRNHPFKGGRRA